MIDISFLLMNAEEKVGGLFDFDGTLPFTILEFLLLMFILERVLYKPLSEIADMRIENLKEKAEKAESTLLNANSLINLYLTEISNVEQKIDILLKQDDSQLKDAFQKRLIEMNKVSINSIIETEQDITKKINELSKNEKAKSAVNVISAFIIQQVIAK
jgi:F-type H+-transporting ATPase subunit b